MHILIALGVALALAEAHRLHERHISNRCVRRLKRHQLARLYQESLRRGDLAKAEWYNLQLRGVR